MGGPLRDGAGPLFFLYKIIWIKNLLIIEAGIEAVENAVIRVGLQVEVHDQQLLQKREVILVLAQALLVLADHLLFHILAERDLHIAKVMEHLPLPEEILDVDLPQEVHHILAPEPVATQTEVHDRRLLKEREVILVLARVLLVRVVDLLSREAQVNERHIVKVMVGDNHNLVSEEVPVLVEDAVVAEHVNHADVEPISTLQNLFTKQL